MTLLDLNLIRCVLNRIHEGGNIFYSKDRMDAYVILAKIASDYRQELLRRYA